MGMTSAAEAKLDARVRPQISELRSRTPYPKRRSDAGSQQTDQSAAEAAVSQAAVSAGVASLAAARHPSVRRAPIRLTRRGRIVVGTLIGIAVAAVAAVIWLAVAGQARASGNAKAGRSGGGAVARVVVKPGQTLWGIAAQADPGADPRVIIPQIVDMNSLSSTAISVGQVLWVPRNGSAFR
jgi:nucleoid-associated protein YgaU